MGPSAVGDRRCRGRRPADELRSNAEVRGLGAPQRVPQTQGSGMNGRCRAREAEREREREREGDAFACIERHQAFALALCTWSRELAAEEREMTREKSGRGTHFGTGRKCLGIGCRKPRTVVGCLQWQDNGRTPTLSKPHDNCHIQHVTCGTIRYDVIRHDNTIRYDTTR